MSGLAKVLRESGKEVSGSDIKESAVTKSLQKLGVEVVIGHSANNINNNQTIVVSTAIKSDNPELIEAKNRKLEIFQRAQMLALIAQDKKVIAISGTHGKTTTTSLISYLFEKNNLDPTFLIGGELNEIGSNAKTGSSEYFIAEADESDGSLLNINPSTLVITNIEADHMDFFSSFEKIKELFITFVGKIKKGGTAIVCADDKNIRELIPHIEGKVITYGKSDENDYYYDSFTQKDLSSDFEVFHKGKSLGNINIKVPGEHNALNVLASIAVGMNEGLSFEKIKNTLATFNGVKRRFQFIGNVDDAVIYDDYAHHPTEVAATLKAASKAGKGRVVCVFQPHRYSRTKFLAKEFGSSFSDADVVVITEIYSAGEAPIEGVTSRIIVDSIVEHEGQKEIAYLPNLEDVRKYLLNEMKKGDIIITMGAGDITSLGATLLNSE